MIWRISLLRFNAQIYQVVLLSLSRIFEYLSIRFVTLFTIDDFLDPIQKGIFGHV